jgi:hypothetical protein
MMTPLELRRMPNLCTGAIIMRCNSRLDSIQAAVFLKLPLLDEYNKAGKMQLENLSSI